MLQSKVTSEQDRAPNVIDFCPDRVSGNHVHATLFESRLSDSSGLTDASFILAVIDRFEEDSTSLEQAVVHAAYDNSYDVYQELIHALKGSAGTIGCTKLCDPGDKLASMDASQYSSKGHSDSAWPKSVTLLR